MDRIEARRIAEFRRLASKAHVRELEAAIEWLDWKKQLEAQDFDTEIARAARADTGAARREEGQLRCLRALQRCLKGDAETGRAEWAEVAAEVPDLALPHLFLARWVAQSDPRAALPHFDRAAEIEPRDANVYWRRGECHERLGDHERAIANFRTAHALDPSSVDGLYAMGKALVMLGKPAEAIRYYDEAISRAPRYVDFYSSRAIALEVMGDHAAAVRDYDCVLARPAERRRALLPGEVPRRRGRSGARD